MHISRYAPKLALSLLVLDKPLDLVDGGRASIPCGLSMIVTKVSCHFLEFDIGETGQVSTRMASVHRRHTLPLDQRHRQNGLLQEMGCRDSCDPQPDDNDTDLHVPFQTWKLP